LSQDNGVFSKVKFSEEEHVGHDGWDPQPYHYNPNPILECPKAIDFVRKAQELHLIHMNISQMDSHYPTSDVINRQLDTIRNQLLSMVDPAIEEVRGNVLEIISGKTTNSGNPH